VLPGKVTFDVEFLEENKGKELFISGKRTTTVHLQAIWEGDFEKRVKLPSLCIDEIEIKSEQPSIFEVVITKQDVKKGQKRSYGN